MSTATSFSAATARGKTALALIGALLTAFLWLNPTTADTQYSANGDSARTSVSETVVVLTVEGRHDLGDRVAYSGLAILTDSSGRQHLERGGSINGRTLQLKFDGATALSRGPAVLTVGSIGLVPGLNGNPAPPETTFLPGTAALLAEVESASGDIEQRAIGRSAAFVGGLATVDSLARDLTGGIVTGHLDGFTADELKSISLGRSVLVLADGATLPAVGGRSGFGPNLSSFQLQFDLLPGSQPAALRLEFGFRVPTGVSPRDEQEARLSGLLQAVGSTTSVPLEAD